MSHAQVASLRTARRTPHSCGGSPRGVSNLANSRAYLVVMDLKSKKSRFLILLLILVCCSWLFHYITGVFDYIPRLRASAKSPDGALTVKVYQKRLMPRPFFPRMGAVARVYDRHGKIIYENIFFR